MKEIININFTIIVYSQWDPLSTTLPLKEENTNFLNIRPFLWEERDLVKRLQPLGLGGHTYIGVEKASISSLCRLGL